MHLNDIQDVYDVVNFLISTHKWNYLDEILENISKKVWRTDVEILVAYRNTTFLHKDKLEFRDKLISECEKFHPDIKWK